MKKYMLFIACALGLIAVSGAVAQNASASPHFEFEITVLTQKSTAYTWGSEHVPMVSYSIKNIGSIPAKLRGLELDWSWTVDNIFLEEGDHLVLANNRVKGGGVGVPTSLTIPPGASREFHFRGTVSRRSNYEQFASSQKAWVRIIGIDYDSGSQGSSASFTYPNWNVPEHAVVDSLPTMPVVSNSSGLSKLQNSSSFGFAVRGDWFMKTKVLVRVAGPALESFGIRDALADPTVSILNSRGESIGNNDDWAMPSEKRFNEVGAFSFKRGSFDAAVEVDLLPGSYTVQVKTASGSPVGSYLVETYQLPDVTSGATVVVPQTPPQVAEKG